MVQQIEELLQHDDPTLAAVEDTLTQGYARALALEAERLRIERRLGEVAQAAATEDPAAEIRSLGTRLTKATGELQRLRALLAPLQDRARTMRAAAAR
jgi:lysophospholipase L1-like esterase